jgi:hypothetical protein
MERAILKTLIYFQIFDYPLKLWEVHKWLNIKCEFIDVEKALHRLQKKRKVLFIKDFVVLPTDSKLVKKRLKNQITSKKLFNEAKLVAGIFKVIPFLKLVGISGNLAMEDASLNDDIDLFIITSKNRIWISRLLILVILEIMNKRRKRADTKKSAAGKVCVNLLIEESNLLQPKKDLYTAHEILQLKVLWERDGVYKKFIEENSWVFEFLPNWIGDGLVESRKYYLSNRKRRSQTDSAYALNSKRGGDILEKLAKSFQLKIMQKPTGMEQIKTGALYFHPEDYRVEVLKRFKERSKQLLSTP